MQLDLNLLTALDALLEGNSVALAAERLFLTPPAMSRTLSRIRYVTGDQILVRTGRSMTPTPYALSIRDEVHTLVRQANALLKHKQTLDLQALERSFTLQCHDAITSAIGAALLARLQDQAPLVRLRLLAEAATDTNDLRHGHVDLEIGAAEPSLPEICCETVAHGGLVVVLRAGHPLLAQKLTLRRYAAARHITVSRRGRLQDPMDEVLSAQGLQRRVVASAPTSTAALQFVRDSDLLVVVPDRICAPTISALGLRTVAMPVALPPIPVNLAWHHRFDTDKAHIWLRGEVRAVLQAVCG